MSWGGRTRFRRAASAVAGGPVEVTSPATGAPAILWLSAPEWQHRPCPGTGASRLWDLAIPSRACLLRLYLRSLSARTKRDAARRRRARCAAWARESACRIPGQLQRNCRTHRRDGPRPDNSVQSAARHSEVCLDLRHKVWPCHVLRAPHHSSWSATRGPSSLTLIRRSSGIDRIDRGAPAWPGAGSSRWCGDNSRLIHRKRVAGGPAGRSQLCLCAATLPGGSSPLHRERPVAYLMHACRHGACVP